MAPATAVADAVPAASTGRVWALLALLHPGPSVATVGVALGSMFLFAHGSPPIRAVLILAAMLTAQQVAISLHNDWCDRALDAVSKPWRAVPRGLVSARLVHTLAWLLAVVSLGAAAPFGWREVALDLVGLGSGFTYNARLKRTTFSWLPFGVAFPLLPLFGAAALGRWPALWWTLFVVGLPAVVAVHLADTIPDLESDAACGVWGLGHRLGRGAARRAAEVATGTTIALGLAFGLALHAVAPAAGAALGAILLAAALARPSAQRVLLVLAVAAVALGCVAALA